MRVARGALAVTVALALGVEAVLLLGYSRTLHPLDAIRGRPPLVEVPDLTDLARPRALADLDSARLEAEVVTAFSLGSPRGAVVGQDPAPGTRVPEGSVVEVVVSRGVARLDMPDAVGRPLGEVVGPFDRIGVDYEVERQPSEEVPEGVVIAQEPSAGRKVEPTDEVRFVVSTGPEPRPVPEVVGISAEGAAFALGRSGFVVGEVTLRADAEAPIGAVLSTDPAGAAVTERDTAVDMVISAGPPPVAVPDVVGQSVSQAAASVEGLGLVPSITGGGATGGRVAATVPPGGTTVASGSLVEVEVTGG